MNYYYLVIGLRQEGKLKRFYWGKSNGGLSFAFSHVTMYQKPEQAWGELPLIYEMYQPEEVTIHERYVAN